MRRCVFFLLLFVSSLAMAQVPDYEKLERETKEKSSNLYYKPLFDRYTRNDTTLTLEEYHIIYYGYFFNPVPHAADGDTRERMQAMMKKKDLDEKDFKELVVLSKNN